MLEEDTSVNIQSLKFPSPRRWRPDMRPQAGPQSDMPRTARYSRRDTRLSQMRVVGITYKENLIWLMEDWFVLRLLVNRNQAGRNAIPTVVILHIPAARCLQMPSKSIIFDDL